MTHGSLFTGIGGIDLGFEWAGIETKWQVEIDDYCQELLSIRFPHTEKFTDVRKVGSHNLEKVDIISGGFPCQDISVAGKGAGIEGERSGLWTELHRVISELRPRFAFIENVPMLTIRGGDELLAILPKSGMMQNGKLWEQTMLVLGTEGNGFGLWRTPDAMGGGTCSKEVLEEMAKGNWHRKSTGTQRQLRLQDRVRHPKLFPTPNTMDHLPPMDKEKRLNHPSRPGRKVSGNLREEVIYRMLPTPSATPRGPHTGKESGSINILNNSRTSAKGVKFGATLQTVVGSGQLNPTWVEWLMGYPSGWTDLKVLETQLSRKSPISSESDSKNYAKKTKPKNISKES